MFLLTYLLREEIKSTYNTTISIEHKCTHRLENATKNLYSQMNMSYY